MNRRMILIAAFLLFVGPHLVSAASDTVSNVRDNAWGSTNMRSAGFGGCTGSGGMGGTFGPNVTHVEMRMRVENCEMVGLDVSITEK